LRDAHRLGAVEDERALGEILGKIADALEIGRDFDRRDDEPEVVGDRPAPSSSTFTSFAIVRSASALSRLTMASIAAVSWLSASPPMRAVRVCNSSSLASKALTI
jgi:hypothetical protein